MKMVDTGTSAAFDDKNSASRSNIHTDLIIECMVLLLFVGSCIVLFFIQLFLPLAVELMIVLLLYSSSHCVSHLKKIVQSP